jgi:hypothetical protein
MAFALVVATAKTELPKFLIRSNAGNNNDDSSDLEEQPNPEGYVAIARVLVEWNRDNLNYDQRQA